MSQINVSAPIVKNLGQITRISVTLDHKKELWFEVPSAYSDFLSDKSDFALIGIAPAAMISGHDIHLEGSVSDRLLHNFQDLIQKLVINIHPKWKNISITSHSTYSSLPGKKRGVLSGLSGGVDSLTTIQTYYLDQKVPKSLKITHLVNNNVGSFRDSGSGSWESRCSSLKELVLELGIPMITVDSNLIELYPPNQGYEGIHTFTNAAVAHLVSSGFRFFHYGSAYRFDQILNNRVKKNDGDIAFLDPILLPLLSSNDLILSSSNPEISRAEKLQIINTSEIRKFLHVCTRSGWMGIENCSTCDKCMRTQLMLEVTGDLNNYVPRPFNLDRYRSKRFLFMARTLYSRDAFSKETVLLAKKNKFKWPVSVKIFGKPINVVYILFKKRKRSLLNFFKSYENLR